MEIFDKVINGINREYSVRILPDDLKAIEEEELNELVQQVRIDGFRPGKVPARLIKSRYGATIASEVKKKAMKELLQFVSKEENLPRVIEYSTEVKKDDSTGIECVCKITTAPEFELQDMSKKKFNKYIYQVTDDDAKKILSNHMESAENWQEDPKHNEIKKGDKVLAHFTLNGKATSKTVDGLNDKDIELVIGDENIVDDIWKHFVGHKVGDVCEFVIHFPKNSSDKNLKGKEVPYKAEIKAVKVKSKFKALDKEFAEYLGYKDIKEAIKIVKEREQARCDRISRSVLERDILDTISKMYDMELPQSMLDIEFKEVRRALGLELNRLGKKDSPAVEEGCRRLAKDRAKIGFVVSKLAEQQKISVSRMEFQHYIENMVRFSPYNEKAIYETYSRPENSAALLGTLLEEKVLEWLISEFEKKSQVNQVSVSMEELNAKDEEMFDFIQNAEDIESEKASPKKKSSSKKEESHGDSGESKTKGKTTKKANKANPEESATESPKKTVRKKTTKKTEEK